MSLLSYKAFTTAIILELLIGGTLAVTNSTFALMHYSQIYRFHPYWPLEKYCRHAWGDVKDEGIELFTSDKCDAYTFFYASGDRQEFMVKAKHDAHVAFAPTTKFVKPCAEVMIDWMNGAQIVFRQDDKKNRENDLTVKFPRTLSEKEFRTFVVTWTDKKLGLYINNSDRYMEYDLSRTSFDIKYVGFASCHGSKGHWIIKVTNERRDKLMETGNCRPTIHAFMFHVTEMQNL